MKAISAVSIATATLFASSTSLAAVIPRSTNVLEISLSSQGSNLSTADGVVIPNRLARRTALIDYKYKRGRAIYQKNTGKSLGKSDLFSDAEVEQLIALPPRMKRQVATDPLTDQSSGALWTGPLSLGTPAQDFVIDFDTGSADLWVPSAQCTSSACSRKNKYTAGSSSTSRAESGTFQIAYGDGSQATGPIYSDTVSVAGATAANQYFGAVTQESAEFSSEADDGIGGMAFASLSNIGQPPFFDNLFSSKAVPANVFSFHLSPTGAVLHLGGTVSSAYTGSITYTPVTAAQYWTVDSSVSVNGQNLGNIAAVIDTGTTLIVAPPADAQVFWESVSGAQECSEADCGSTGFYTFPCSSAPTVSFVFSGKSFDVPADTFNLGQVSQGSSQCVGAVIAQDAGDGSWIVGDSFLQGVYAVFDKAELRVGFATPA